MPIRFSPVQSFINHVKPTVRNLNLSQEAGTHLLTEKSSEALAKHIHQTEASWLKSLVAVATASVAFSHPGIPNNGLLKTALGGGAFSSLAVFMAKDKRKDELYKIAKHHPFHLGAGNVTHDSKVALNYFKGVKPHLRPTSPGLSKTVQVSIGDVATFQTVDPHLLNKVLPHADNIKIQNDASVISALEDADIARQLNAFDYSKAEGTLFDKKLEQLPPPRLSNKDVKE